MADLDVEDISERFVHIADELGEIPVDRALTGTPRLNFAIATLTLAMEHFDGIAILTNHGRCGTAAALIRPLIEAGTRGAWLALSATEEEAAAFAKNDKAVDRPAMLKGLSGIEWLDHTAFQADPALWRHLHGLTHGGFNQATHRLRGGVISGIYPPAFVDGMLKHAVSVGAWTTIVLATVMGVENPKARVADILTRHAWYVTKVDGAPQVMEP